MNTTDTEPENISETLARHRGGFIAYMSRIYTIMTSAKLAMGLLVTILACCITGVTIFREARAGELIFSTLWFNGLLVLLVVNVACCFFGRVWGRRVTVISFGMILFHLSFVAMFIGIIYNSLFYFRGVIRLSEGETLSSAVPQNYDMFKTGRLFSFSNLKGEISLLKFHLRYSADGKDKKVAYEVAIDDGKNRKQEIIYVTKNLSYNGVKYFRDKEGYTLLTVISDKKGNDLYGAYVPLQSIKVKKNDYLYTTGAKDGAAPMLFPAPPVPSQYSIQLSYLPSKLNERGGDTNFKIWPITSDGKFSSEKPLVEATVPIGSRLAVGEKVITVPEVRYWVGMQVTYEPGQPLVLASLWVGLTGMIITTAGRMMRGRRKWLPVDAEESDNNRDAVQ